MQLSSTTMLTVAATLAWITWAATAAPIMNSTTNASAAVGGNGSSAGDRQFEFHYNCSSAEAQSKNESNSTHIDFAIGLFVLKDYLKGVRVCLLALCSRPEP